MRHIFYIVMMLACALMSACGHYVPEVGPSVEPAMETLVAEARDGYECRFVEFSVEPSERIKAYLLVPDGASEGKVYPAVLMLHDHGARFDIGKEKLVRPIASVTPGGSDGYGMKSSRQWVDINFDGVYVADSLARMGYVVLVADALYWGGRSTDDAQLWSRMNFDDAYVFPDRDTLIKDGVMTVETDDAKIRKSVIKRQKEIVYEGQRKVYAELQAQNVIWAEKMLRDDAACVNLLAGLPYVDKERIGAFGFSMGAHRCWMHSAFWEGVKCGVALSWMSALENYKGGHASDLSMCIKPMRDQMDFGDIGIFLAPKPMLFLNGETDHLFAKEDVEVAFEKLHSHYASYNKSRGIEGSAPLRTRFFDGGHHCSKREQSVIFSYFDEYLKNGA